MKGICDIIKHKCLSENWKVGKSMISSMTGYGRYEIEENERKVVVELSSVNHRYLDLNIKMPRQLIHLEEQIRGLIKQKVARGKVELLISYQSLAKEDLAVVVNEAMAAAYLDGLRHLGQKLGVEDDLKLSALMNVNELVSIQKKGQDQECISSLIEKAVEGALLTFTAMRCKEGEHLREDILKKNENLKQYVAAIDERSPQVVIQYKTKLETRIAQLLNEVPIDENRIATEVAIFADKCAVDEEITRLNSHIKQFEDILDEGGVVGRKLDFLMQEMNREANTIGSKANDNEITKAVVALKNEMEKIREQVQNIE